MAVTQIGTDLEIGVATVTNYVVQEITSGGSPNILMEDVFDEDGALETRIVFQVQPKLGLRMVSKSGATPATDFPEGGMSTIATYSNRFVNSCRITTVAGAQRVDVELETIGIT